MTNQLIDLERHFNTFELHKFGDNDGVHTGRRALQSRFGPSRYVYCSLLAIISSISEQISLTCQSLQATSTIRCLQPSQSALQFHGGEYVHGNLTALTEKLLNSVLVSLQKHAVPAYFT